jgi:hypothetical protein
VVREGKGALVTPLEDAQSPHEVAVAGDWHGNTRWAVFMLEQAARELEGEVNKVVLHAGDFLPTFYWPVKRPGWTAAGDEAAAADRRKNVNRYLYTIETTCRKLGLRLMAVDGNHEDWELLSEARARWSQMIEPFGDTFSEMPIPLKSTCSSNADDLRVFWLPRGTRWEWHGKTWLAFGGAVSPNRAWLTEGWNWWPDEEPSVEDVKMAVAAGHADVVLAHEVPKSVHIQYGKPPKSWEKADLQRADRFRLLLDGVAESVTPGFWVHGHHHIGYCKGVNQPWGLMWSTGLESDGGKLNLMILDTEELTWRVPEHK